MKEPVLLKSTLRNQLSRGCRAGDPGAGRGGVSRDKGFSPSTPGSPPRGLCAVGWLGGAVRGQDPQKLISQRALNPLAPEVGGLADTHQGGRQFASEDDPDWKNMKACHAHGML